MTGVGRSSGAPPLVPASVLVPALVLALVASSGLSRADSEPRVVQLPGNVTFGGLFPMHEQRSSDGQATCGRIKEEKGIQRLEAMLWAVDEINRDPRLLPGIQIGVRILDTCSSGTYALEQSMEFVRSNMNQVRWLPLEKRERLRGCLQEGREFLESVAWGPYHQCN